MGLGSRVSGLCLLSSLPGVAWGFHAWQPATRHQSPAARRLRMSSSGTTSGDVLVIGGGLAGLSTALELSRRGAKVMVLNRDASESASMAAGGMLAPQAERLPAGPYLDLCLQSRSMYPDWAALLEDIAGPGFSTGFSASGGFLAPAFEGDPVFHWQPPLDAGPSYWLDRTQIRSMEPLISEEVVGGWWYPEDMQVDARLLYKTLREACVRSQVTILEGQDATAEAVVFHPVNPAVKSVRLRDGRRLQFDKVVVANGAWMNELLPIPVASCKGQMLSLRPQPGTPPPLSRVLFGDGCYIIPKTDGRIVVGATVEDGIMDRRVTARGVAELTGKAMRVCPGLADLEVEETWAGLRPTTPDFLPVLGATPWANLYVAGGYWRNGVLLAPRTGELVADLMEGRVSGADEALLEHFSWKRFLAKGSSSSARSSPSSASRSAVRSKLSSSSSPVVFPEPSPAISSKAPTPVQQQQQYTAPQAAQPSTSESGTGDPYETYKQGARGRSEEEEEQQAAALREARRKNREDAIQIGMELDPLGREVGSRFAVPSSPLSREWSVFDDAAQKGEQAIASMPWTMALDSSKLGAPAQGSRQQGGQRTSMTISEMAAMLGYDLDGDAPQPRGQQQSSSPANPKAFLTEPDTYDEEYSSDPRKDIGWEEAKRIREQGGQQAGGQQQQQHTDDPYADLVKLREEQDRIQVLREARRVNREGMVTLDEDAAASKEDAARFSVPTAGESRSFDQLAAQGLASGAVLPLGKENKGSGPGSSREGGGESIAALMARLGYTYEDPREARAVAMDEAMRSMAGGSAMSSRQKEAAASFQPAAPKPQQATTTMRKPEPQQQAPPAPKPAPPSPASNAPLPPWADEIDALYDRVKTNQADARRRQGLAVTGKEEVVLPFQNTEVDGGLLSEEERLQMFEMVRVNPDGSMTKVEPGKGLPPPWMPNQQQQQQSHQQQQQIEEQHLQHQQQSQQQGRNSSSAGGWPKRAGAPFFM